MNIFNSDVALRLAVAVQLANAAADHTLPGTGDDRPRWIFESQGYLAPDRDADWQQLADLAGRLGALLELITAGEHSAAVSRLNRDLAEAGVTPYLERSRDGWALHFHRPDASFAQGWAGGIATALTVSYSTGDEQRIGRCTADDCAHFFLDRGRNRRRRFCTLQCQNRVKSAAYRQRQEPARERSLSSRGAAASSRNSC